ncbi:MAG: alcohol dehydrogenase catalytic domain-containing protein [Candidatus Thorarchaeota archaeon]|nr:MAG: alcohol dehydrogenase catalytic domain-containing protein [Candidatus Thorarchaeota archaeon]
MKSAVLHGPKDLRIDTIEIPKPDPGWILLKVKAAGICGSDLHLYKEKTFIPINSVLGEGIYVPGHELSGEVYEVGEGVTTLSKGDRVAVEPTVNCGRCNWCQIGWYNICVNSGLIGFYYIGGLAEYCVVPEDKCFKLPKNVSFEEAATLDCIAVAEHAINRAEVSSEDSVAILGAGSIGLFAVQGALHAGARNVFVTGTHDFQTKAAERFGATAVINARKENTVERIMELTNGRGVDKVIEAVGGDAPVLDEGVNMLRRRGILVATGIFLNPMPINMFSLVTKEVRLMGAWGYGYWTHMKEFALSLEMLATGKIDAKPVITHKYPLEETSKAFEVALDKKKSESIKVQIVF